MESEWSKLLQRTKANDLVAGQKLISIDSNRTINDCLQLLKENDITALPVKDLKNNNKALGFVDVLDICSYALYLWREYCRNPNTNFTQAVDGNKFFNTNVADIINFSKRNFFLQLPVTATLLDCFNCFKENQYKSHRLALLNEQGQVMKLVSMMDLVKFANKHVNLLPWNDSYVKDMNVLKACIMLRQDAPFANALSVLCDNGISGLALVDMESKVIANLSATDLKGIFPYAFDMFWNPTIDFLRNATQTKSKIPPRCFDLKCQLRDVIRAISEEKIHRIFLTDEFQRPSGIITCTDVVECLTPKPSMLAASQ